LAQQSFSDSGPLYTFLDHQMIDAYHFNKIDRLDCSYDEKYKNVSCIPYKDAPKYLSDDQCQRISFTQQNISDMIKITKYTLDSSSNMYLFGSNRGDKFVVERISSNLQMIDKILPIGDDIFRIIMSIMVLVIFLGLLLLEIDVEGYQIVRKN
jgi:hypothetical protein